MSNLFEDVLKNAKGVEESLIGPDYPYYKYIKMPDQLGMSSEGNLSALGRDVAGLVSYTQLLVAGNGAASVTGRPLGNKFFLKTGAKCNDISKKQKVDRYVYIDNVPAGNIPFISSGMGVNFKDFKGLIPGTISNLNYFNPFTIMQAFLTGGNPDCQELTMETIDVNNNRSTESHYVTLIDIQNMDPCIFPNRTNPITKAGCRETFTNGNGIQNHNNLTKDVFVQSYFASLSVLGIYILYCTMSKIKS